MNNKNSSEHILAPTQISKPKGYIFEEYKMESFVLKNEIKDKKKEKNRIYSQCSEFNQYNPIISTEISHKLIQNIIK